MTRRPTVSMTQAIFLLASWASQHGGVSRCAWVADAIQEKFERDGIEPVPPGWIPERRRGGPRVTAAQRRANSEEFFSGVKTL